MDIQLPPEKPAIVQMAGQPCVVIGSVPAIIGTYDDRGRCVLSDAAWFRPAMPFDLGNAKRGR